MNELSDLRGTVAQTGPHLLFPLWMAPDNCHHWEHFRFSLIKCGRVK